MGKPVSSIGFFLFASIHYLFEALNTFALSPYNRLTIKALFIGEGSVSRQDFTVKPCLS